jgi:hypothetical protein
MLAFTAGSSALYRSVPNFYQENNETKMQLAKHALRLWNVPHVPREVNRSNARKWLRAVERLGDKWLVGQPRTKEQLMLQQKGQQ